MSDSDTDDMEKAVEASESTLGEAVGALVAQNPEIITLVKAIAIVVGLAVVVKNLMRIGRIAEGKENATYGKAISLLAIGLILINFYWFLDVLVQSMGLDSTWRESAAICYSGSGVSDACSAADGDLAARTRAMISKLEAALALIGVLVVAWGLFNLHGAFEQAQPKLGGFVRIAVGALLLNARWLSESFLGFFGI